MTWRDCKTAPPPEWVKVLVYHRSRPWGGMTIDTGRIISGRWLFAPNTPTAEGGPWPIYQPRRWAYEVDAIVEAETIPPP